jgi:hypothetical protein
MITRVKINKPFVYLPKRKIPILANANIKTRKHKKFETLRDLFAKNKFKIIRR